MTDTITTTTIINTYSCLDEGLVGNIWETNYEGGEMPPDTMMTMEKKRTQMANRVKKGGKWAKMDGKWADEIVKSVLNAVMTEKARAVRGVGTGGKSGRNGTTKKLPEMAEEDFADIMDFMYGDEKTEKKKKDGTIVPKGNGKGYAEMTEEERKIAPQYAKDGDGGGLVPRVARMKDAVEKAMKGKNASAKVRDTTKEKWLLAIEGMTAELNLEVEMIAMAEYDDEGKILVCGCPTIVATAVSKVMNALCYIKKMLDDERVWDLNLPLTYTTNCRSDALDYRRSVMMTPTEGVRKQKTSAKRWEAFCSMTGTTDDADLTEWNEYKGGKGKMVEQMAEMWARVSDKKDGEDPKVVANDPAYTTNGEKNWMFAGGMSIFKPRPAIYEMCGVKKTEIVNDDGTKTIKMEGEWDTEKINASMRGDWVKKAVSKVE